MPTGNGRFLQLALLFLNIIAVPLVLASIGCGSATPVPPGSIPVSIEGVDGQTDVNPNSSFIYEFSKAIEVDTVTTSTFFMVEGAASADIASPIKADIDSGVCDSNNAIDSSVTCESSTSGVLDPTGILSEGTTYTICLTSDITYADGTAFEGFTATFRTSGSPPTYSVGGTITGLVGTVVLQNNGGDNLSLSTGAETFTFDTELANNLDYAVTVLTQPATQTCTVASGTGTIDGADIADTSESVTVTCEAAAIVMFATETLYDGNLGGRAGADVGCESEIPDGLTCTDVRAFIGVDYLDEIRDMPTNYGVPTVLPIKSQDGNVIQDSWTDLLSGAILLSLYNAGVLGNVQYVWSGSTEDGVITVSSHCVNWTNGSGTFFGQRGRSDYSDLRWLNYDQVVCNNTAYLLCLCY